MDIPSNGNSRATECPLNLQSPPKNRKTPNEKYSLCAFCEVNITQHIIKSMFFMFHDLHNKN
jgi:hypothetical protein